MLIQICYIQKAAFEPAVQSFRLPLVVVRVTTPTRVILHLSSHG